MSTITKIDRQAPPICLIRFDDKGWHVLDTPTKDPYLILGTLWGGRVTGQA